VDLFRSRIIAGQTMMSIWSGMDNGIPTADMNPGEIAPITHIQLQWPQWGMHYETRGEKGSPPDLPAAAELMKLYKEWQASDTAEKRAAVWHRMLSVYTDNVFSIGIVNATLQPVVASAKLKNLPAKGLYSFDPTCYFGVYMPDTFWLDGGS
jgi:peptide/nickel transport system substrate-binding protein